MLRLTPSSTLRLALRLCQTAMASVALVALAGIGGCTNAAPSDYVTGKVTFGDAPVTGEITFTGNGKSEKAPLGPDGGYYIPNPPIGECKILIKEIPGMVFTPSSAATGKETKKISTDLGDKGKAAMQMAVAPPKKYSLEANALSFEVKKGANKHDIVLTK
jgi:hypothetical protein